MYSDNSECLARQDPQIRACGDEVNESLETGLQHHLDQGHTMLHTWRTYCRQGILCPFVSQSPSSLSLSLFVSFCLCLCLTVSLCVSVSVCLSVCLCLSVSVSLSLSLPARFLLSVCLPSLSLHCFSICLCSCPDLCERMHFTFLVKGWKFKQSLSLSL